MLPKLGILAGNGQLPVLLVNACKSLKRPFTIITFQGQPHELAEEGQVNEMKIAEIGKIIKLLKKEEVEEIVMAGGINRPPFSKLRPDFEGTKLLGKMLKARFTGDNNILSLITEYLESKQFKVVGADEVLEDLLMPEGVLGKVSPNGKAKDDIVLGKSVAQALGDLDVGQAVIVENGLVLGVEAVEGTDNLLERCAKLRKEEKGGVLVKMKKPNQDRRVDLPSIGTVTVEKVKEAGFDGIAIEAGGALIIDKEAVIEKANQLGIFLEGVKAD